MSLLVVERVNPPSGVVKEIELPKPGWEKTEIAQIGRSEIVDWFGPFDQSDRVSRKHLRIVLSPMLDGSVLSVRISDTGSTNGSSPNQAIADVGGIGTPPGSEPRVAEIVLAGVVTLRFTIRATIEALRFQKTRVRQAQQEIRESVSAPVMTPKKDSPFTEFAGQTFIPGAPKDDHGNAEGTQYDLAKDDAFDGMKVVVLHFYTLEGFDFKKPKAALEQKGFKVVRHTKPPTPRRLISDLKDASQLWIISTSEKLLNDKHLKTIKDFFDEGKGVYIWGDNDPYYADANFVGSALLESGMYGNSPGDKVLNEAKGGGSGFVQHQITTGLEFLYEGITIAAIQDPSERLVPIMRGSDGHIVTACFDRDGKRALIDGGFTRLFLNWDDAGTARFVKNAAAWLVNWERNQAQMRPEPITDIRGLRR